MTGSSDSSPELDPELELELLEGERIRLSKYRGSVLLIVNVASRCSHTPQYAELQQLHDRFGPRGFQVLGFPCNQFLFQEPGSGEQIRQFCSVNYGIGFPLFAKIKVRGRSQHPLFRVLAQVPDGHGRAGDLRWNFEKFLIDRTGTVQNRFRSAVQPGDPDVVAAIEHLLA